MGCPGELASKGTLGSPCPPFLPWSILTGECGWQRSWQHSGLLTAFWGAWDTCPWPWGHPPHQRGSWTEPCPAPSHLARPYRPLWGGGEPWQQAFTLVPTDGSICSLQQLPERGGRRAGAPSKLAQPWEERVIWLPD